VSASAEPVSKPGHARNEWAAERHVYEPHLVGLPPVGQYLSEVWRRREFAIELSRTRLRAQHHNTIFGQPWLVLNPLLLAGVYFILIDIIRRGHHPPGFFGHLVAGIFAYYFVRGAIGDSVKSVTNGSRLILNSAFPRMLLPLADVVTAFKRFVPCIIVYIPVHILAGLPVGPQLLWVIPLVALMTILAAGFAMIVSALQVYFRDLRSFLPFVLRLGLYISPVLYLASEAPHRYAILLNVNPVGQLLAAWSDVLYAGHAPSVHEMVVGTAWSVGVVTVGALFFMSREREFAVRL
jgi:teichoic acid transport system permease protein